MRSIPLVMLVGLGLSACSGGDPLTRPTAVTLANIVIMGGGPSLPVGGTVQLSLIATLTDGVQQDQTTTASWSSSNPGVAAVSSTGLVTGLADGTADIRVAYQGASLAKAIRVEIPKPADPTVTASISVTTSPEAGIPWRAHLVVAYTERRGSTGFTVDSAQIDYRDANHQSLFVRFLGPNDFIQTWGVNRLQPGQTLQLGRSLDFTRVDSTVTVDIITSVTDDLGNTTRLTATATGRAVLSAARPMMLSIGGPIVEGRAR